MVSRAYDPDEAIVLYLCGMAIQEVADEYGVPKATIYSHLRANGVEIRFQASVPRSDTCAQGHSMHDSLPVKGGGRACRMCKRKRDRAYKARARAKKAGRLSTS